MADEDVVFLYRPGWPWRWAMSFLMFTAAISGVVFCGQLLAAGQNDVALVLASGGYAVTAGLLGYRARRIEIRVTADTVTARNTWRDLTVPLSDVTRVRRSVWLSGRVAVLTVRGRRRPFAVNIEPPEPQFGLRTFFQSDEERVQLLRDALGIKERPPVED